MPVMITPKDAVVKDEEPKVDDLEIIKPTNDEVFDGTYDSKAFDLGTEYVEDTYRTNMQAQKSKEAKDKPTVDNADLDHHVTYDESFPNFYSHADSIDFEKHLMGQGKEEDGVIPTSNPGQQSQPTYVAKETGNSEEVHQSFQTQEPAGSQQPEAVTNQAAADEQSQEGDEEYLDYAQLANSVSQYDPSFTNIPNTLNGEIRNSIGELQPGSLLYVYDQNGQIVRTMATDPQGRYYSYAPFAAGLYYVLVGKDMLLFSRYYVYLNDNVIPPKIIQSKN